LGASIPLSQAALAHALAEAAWMEARNSLREEIEQQCARWLDGLVQSLVRQMPELIEAETQRALAWAVERGEDVQVWRAAAAFAHQNLEALLRLAPGASTATAAGLL